MNARTKQKPARPTATAPSSALFDQADVVLLLLDHQTGLFQTVKDIDVAELRANVRALAKMATLM